MKIAGIICEYNPMHNGHVYHIEKTRQAGASHIVCVMSGNFVQRGECAFLDKWTRADVALNCGADLVVDLPTPWACDSAQNFALGAVSILDGLGIDMLSFGSEIDDAGILRKCALASDDERVVSSLKRGLQSGKSYPLSLYEAVLENYGKETAEVISSPNSTLALEYIKALEKLSSKAEIFPVKRFMSKHDSLFADDNFASAAAIRSFKNIEEAKCFMPEYAFQKMTEQIENGFSPCTFENGERAVLSKLRSLSKDEIAFYAHDESGLHDRIYESVKTATSLNELFEKIKTKNVTMAKVRRSVLRLYLGIKPEILLQKPPYIKVLASNEKGFEILRKLSDEVTVITKHSDATKLSDFGKTVYDLQCRTTDLFGIFSKKIRTCCLEQTSPFIINSGQ